ncbi:Branched-chain amino acid aminotransferase [Aspergillus sclerotialis]|uniref:Branched-chain amino acid aminotransferase n=1 Tax=Aspergillus sclerotialis TaxID=2070753 RepID=A0A3A3A5Z7_9EURO|nr:Branched-chain amino acid aminotransferase [Aspergillus sclerotialis]
MSPEFAFPPPPANLDWNNIGIKIREVNGHVQCRYNVQTGRWSEPEVVKGTDLTISGLSPALNYGMQAYEGMKAFRDPTGQIRIFRPTEHAARMRHSCEFVSIPSLPTDHFVRCVSLAVSINAEFVPPHDTSAALYIRPLVFGSGPQINLLLPDEYTFCVFVLPVTSLLGTQAVDAVILEEFDRTAPMGTGSAKVGGNYAPVLRWSMQAKAQGYGTTLHLDSKTRSEIDEFSAAGFIGVKQVGEEVTLVVPNSSSIIRSITSDSCLELARSFGWTVEVRPVKYEELAEFSEVLAVGTAAVLVPIRSITRSSLGDKYVYAANEEGNYICAMKLFKAIQDIQRGLVEDLFSWCAPIQEPGKYLQTGEKSDVQQQGV